MKSQVKVGVAEQSKSSENNEDTKYQNNPNKQLNWPPTEKDQEKFRELAKKGHQYKELQELIPPKGGQCNHNYHWSAECPKEKGWVDSRNIKILHSSYIEPKSRISYYRKAVGCSHGCRLQWTGEDDFLLNMSSVYNNGKGRVQIGGARGGCRGQSPPTCFFVNLFNPFIRWHNVHLKQISLK